jgi:hypothetical protein
MVITYSANAKGILIKKRSPTAKITDNDKIVIVDSDNWSFQNQNRV